MIRPTCTPTSIIKKVFRPGERSLPTNEIIQRLTECLPAARYDGDSEQMLAEVLQLPHSPIKVGRSDAIIELTYQPHHIFDLAYRYVRDTHAPKTIDQIIRELRRQTNLSWNQASRMLVLEQDPRFVQYQQDNRWYLAEWKVANDLLYAHAIEKGMAYMSIRALTHFIENELGLSPKEYILLPELDDRFDVDGDLITFLKEEEAFSEIAAATAEELHSQTDIEEDTNMNTVQTLSVYHEVDQLLRQSLSKLEARGQEMSVEVVGHFQQSNMQAIENLMKEKQLNEQAALGIQQVLALLEQQ